MLNGTKPPYNKLFSEANILTKANEVIKNLILPELLQTPPPKKKIFGVKKLPSRAFFLEMNSESSADLLQQSTLRTDFIRKFNDSIKPNNYLIIAEFVPTSFDPSLREELAAVESANALQLGNVTIVQLIKPPEK